MTDNGREDRLVFPPKALVEQQFSFWLSFHGNSHFVRLKRASGCIRIVVSGKNSPK